MNNNSSSCVPLAWSADDADAVGPSLYVCIIALVFHTIFWLTIFFYSSLRQWKSMQWLYAFLVIDLLLLVRFYILYGLRTSSACVTPTVRSSVCYFESVGDIYLNCLQGYVLLALNVCRHIQITRGGADVYSTYRCRMFIMHCLIYLIPLVIIIIEIKSGWAVVYYRPGGSCDLDFPLLLTRLINLTVVHCVPVFLTLLFLCLSLRHVRLTVASMNTQQIIDVRRKHHRFLVFQSFVFYSVWLLLWSPHVILSQFIHISSTIGAITQLLNYIELTSDPIIITALDVRFLKAWKKSFAHMKGQVVPVMNG